MPLTLTQRWQNIKKDKYKKRSTLICLGITVFVFSTICIAIGIYVSQIGHRRSTNTQDSGKENETQENYLSSTFELPNETVFSPESRPNILFITLDDLRPALGCYGDKIALTPNIDQIAERGFLFTNAYAQQALCAPSRASFLTSRRPDSLHVYDQSSYWRKMVGDVVTLPEYLKRNGYFTASIGKIFHHGPASNNTDDYPNSWSTLPYWPSTRKYKMKKECPSADGELHMNLVCPVDVTKQPEQSLPDLQNLAKAQDFINHQLLTSPFFLGVGFYKPHIPLKFPKQYLDLYPLEGVPLSPNRTKPANMPDVAWNPWTDIRLREDVQQLNLSFPYGPITEQFQRYIRQSYYASISYVDDLIGRLLLSLEESELSNNTAIVLLGDHGWSLGEHQEWSKYSNFDVSTHVPLLIALPGSSHTPYKHIPLNSNAALSHRSSFKTVNRFVELVDLFPTVAEIANLPVPPTCPKNSSLSLCTEGRSVLPLLRDPETRSWKEAAFSQYPRPSSVPQNNSDQPELKDIHIMGYSMRTEKYRYTQWIEFDNTLFVGNWSNVIARELYLEDVDPGEMNNVAEHPENTELVWELAENLRKSWRNL